MMSASGSIAFSMSTKKQVRAPLGQVARTSNASLSPGSIKFDPNWVAFELQRKAFYFPLYWLFRDP